MSRELEHPRNFRGIHSGSAEIARDAAAADPGADDGAPPEGAAPAANPSKDRDATPVESRGRILVVDDEANARTALAELLRDDGYVVETAADGFKALPKLEDFAPDVLLTDLKMPGMSGIELMRKAREHDPESATVVMTA